MRSSANAPSAHDPDRGRDHASDRPGPASPHPPGREIPDGETAVPRTPRPVDPLHIFLHLPTAARLAGPHHQTAGTRAVPRPGEELSTQPVEDNMINRKTALTTALLLLFAAAPALAQQHGTTSGSGEGSGAAATKAAPKLLYRDITIQYVRPQDARGINVFEPPKDDDTPFNGLKLEFGAAFTQQFQALDHSNTAAPNIIDGVDLNRLVDLGPGFNLATANLYLNAQLAPGVRVALESYMSSRHHAEFWVKGGYLQIDASPIE